MSFTGNEDHSVTVAAAAEMNRKFRKDYPTQPHGIYFSQKTIKEILSQQGCVGIRFYFAADETSKMRLTFVGVDVNENDIIGLVGDGGVLCPPCCGNSNALNS